MNGPRLLEIGILLCSSSPNSYPFIAFEIESLIAIVQRKRNTVKVIIPIIIQVSQLQTQEAGE